MQQQRERGFTLVEMMVVVAIIAVLAGLLIGVNSRTYGASATNVTQQVSSTLGYAKMRAVSTRRVHQVEIKNQEVSVWASDVVGFGAATTWMLVQSVKIPDGIEIWEVGTTAPTAKNTSLDFSFLFRPDGSSNTGGTIYITDRQHTKELFVRVFKATGSSYARQNW